MVQGIVASDHGWLVVLPRPPGSFRRGWVRCRDDWRSGTVNGALFTPGYLLRELMHGPYRNCKAWYFIQPIPLAVTFSNAVSKLKALTSLFTETWQERRSSFELWTFENVNPSGIGCTRSNKGRGSSMVCTRFLVLWVTIETVFGSSSSCFVMPTARKPCSNRLRDQISTWEELERTHGLMIMTHSSRTKSLLLN